MVVNSGGTITAGTGVGATTLTIASRGLTINDGGAFATTLFGTGPTDISLLDVTGGTMISPNADITLDLSELSMIQADMLRSDVGVGNTRVYTVMSGRTGNNFSASNFTITDLGSFQPSEWMFNTMPITGLVQINFSPVPEPTCVLAVCLAASAVVYRWRRRATTA